MAKVKQEIQCPRCKYQWKPRVQTPPGPKTFPECKVRRDLMARYDKIDGGWIFVGGDND